MHEIFISYSRHDSTTAHALAEALTQTGRSIWLDRNAIQEGDAFDTQIEDAIAETRVVVVIWSQHSVKSHWVRAEAAYALGKHKLLPISIDQSEPPLQFLNIQTIDFRYWDHTSKHHAFRQLNMAVAKRLDGPVPGSGAASHPSALHHTVPDTTPEHHRLVEQLHAWLITAGLRFPEKVIELEYRDYFRERTYIIGQFSMLLAAATYVVYGVADMATASGGMFSTRFRFMFVIPLMLAFFALSFRPFARRHSQLFLCVFAIIGTICTFINVLLIGAESPFRVDTGNGAMNAMLLLGFFALAPYTLGNTVMLGLLVSALHGALTMHAGLSLSTTWLYYLHVGSMFTLTCCIAFWREHFYRKSFAAELT